MGRAGPAVFALRATPCHAEPARTKPTRRRGFTLMEVNLALFIMGIGLFGLLALFPVGVRSKSMATSDTTQAAFASLVLNGLRANAQAVTNWSSWLTLTNGVELGVNSNFPPTAAANWYPLYADAGSNIPIQVNASGIEIEDYPLKGQYLKYKLGVEFDPYNPRVVNAWVQIITRRYTDISLSPYYATAFVYQGM